MSRATPATQALDRAGVAYRLHEYDYDPRAENIGRAAAERLGIDPAIMLKSLMVLVDGKPVCAVAPSDADISLKRLAQAAGGKSAQMMRPEAAERLTGYRIGGVSPLGQRRPCPVVIEAGVMVLARVFVNGGRRGLQVEIAPADLAAACGAKAAPLR